MTEPGKRGYKPSDAGRRLSDAYNLHRVAAPYDSIGKWIIARLYDGSTVDNELYPSKLEAVRHAKHNEKHYAFIQITPAQFTPEMADAMLSVYRKASESSTFKIADPDHVKGGYEPIRRLTQRDQYNQLAAMFGKRPPSNLIY